MPYSTPFGKSEIALWVCTHFKQGATCLDAGAERHLYLKGH